MPIIMLEEFYVRKENRVHMQELRVKRNKLLEKVKPLKSIKTYQQSYGGMGDAFIEFLEFEDMTEMDRFGKEAFAIAEFAAIAEEMRAHIEPASLTRKIWRQVT